MDVPPAANAGRSVAGRTSQTKNLTNVEASQRSTSSCKRIQPNGIILILAAVNTVVLVLSVCCYHPHHRFVVLFLIGRDLRAGQWTGISRRAVCTRVAPMPPVCAACTWQSGHSDRPCSTRNCPEFSVWDCLGRGTVFRTRRLGHRCTVPSAPSHETGHRALAARHRRTRVGGDLDRPSWSRSSQRHSDRIRYLLAWSGFTLAAISPLLRLPACHTPVRQ